MRHGLLHREIVLILLLLVCVDIGWAQPYCCGEQYADSQDSHRTSTNILSEDQSQKLAARSDFEARGQERPAISEDDCFCCGRMTSGPGHASELVISYRLPQSPLAFQWPQSPPLRGTFHPPRQA